MPHDHSHHHLSGVSERRLKFSVFLTLAFVTAEATAGWFSNSLALLSDAGHNFADALALGVSWYALAAARKASTSKMTFGYHRVGILAALVNAVALVLIAIGIAWEAAQRLKSPEEVQSGVMIGVATLAVGVNVLIAVWLHHCRHDINVRSAYVHTLGDAVSAFGVVVAGVVIWLTHSTLPDPIVSFLIAVLIVYSSWGILKESVTVLLEGAPHRIDVAAVAQCIGAVESVQNVHDLHVWTVGPGVTACSCHIDMCPHRPSPAGNRSSRPSSNSSRIVLKSITPPCRSKSKGCGPNEDVLQYSCGAAPSLTTVRIPIAGSGNFTSAR